MHASYISYFNVIAPLTTLSLGLLLVGCWNFARTQKELLWISAGYILPALLLLAQSGVDNDGLARWTLVTSPIYISSAWFLGYGLALRYKTKSHPLVAFCVVIACMALLYYFSIISPNLPLRIIILNVGILIAQTLALPSILISAKSFTIWDRLLLSSFILYTLLILFRILVTNNASDTDILTRSPYWRYLLTSTLFFGLWFMAILLGTTITGIVSKLRHERDHDPLTGLLNRRGFTERAQDKLKAHQHHQHPYCHSTSTILKILTTLLVTALATMSFVACRIFCKWRPEISTSQHALAAKSLSCCLLTQGLGKQKNLPLKSRTLYRTFNCTMVQVRSQQVLVSQHCQLINSWERR